jgi:hemerythrin-like metal-binding protein
LASNEQALIWTDAQRVGVEVIDADHQVIMRLLNKIMRTALGDPELPDDVTELTAFVEEHFRREEAIMAAVGYPDLEQHRAGHRNFDAKVSGFAAISKEGGSKHEFMAFQHILQRWWRDHLSHSDIDIAHYIKGKERQIRGALENIS